MMGGMLRSSICSVILLLVVGNSCVKGEVALAPVDTLEGYVARLLINETAFPGEEFWLSEDDTCSAQKAIICVLRNRLHAIPVGYTQRQIAAVKTDDVFDIITAGGEHGQVEGFYRDENGRPVMVDRVRERVDYLVALANRGKPGRIARMLQHAQSLASQFVSELPKDRFELLSEIDGVPVTGCAYGWMTDRECYRVGGSFVRITDKWRGGMGGNRFFSLKKRL